MLDTGINIILYCSQLVPCFFIAGPSQRGLQTALRKNKLEANRLTFGKPDRSELTGTFGTADGSEQTTPQNTNGSEQTAHSEQQTEANRLHHRTQIEAKRLHFRNNNQ
jgi:hypothetical protein